MVHGGKRGRESSLGNEYKTGRLHFESIPYLRGSTLSAHYTKHSHNALVFTFFFSFWLLQKSYLLSNRKVAKREKQ